MASALPIILSSSQALAPLRPQAELLPRTSTGDVTRAHNGAIERGAIESAARTTVIYVRTDYFTRTAPQNRVTVDVTTSSGSGLTQRDAGADAGTASRHLDALNGTSLSDAKPVELYNRIQTSPSATKGTLIDVFA